VLLPRQIVLLVKMDNFTLTSKRSGALFILTTIYQYLRRFESTVSDTRSNVEEVYYCPINRAMFVVTKAFTDMFKEQDLELYG
jgi:hypothetical protein